MPTAAQIFYTQTKGVDDTLPLVLVHGAGGSHLDWPGELRRVPGFPVLALDLPGHGRSTGTGQSIVSDYATALLRWLDVLAIPRAVFCGHSLGGAIALTLGLDNPTRAAGLILIGAGAKLRVAPQILEGIKSHQTQTAAQIATWSWAENAPAESRAIMAARLAATPSETLYGDFLACDRFDMMARVSEIHCPTLVIVGAQDRMMLPKYSTFLAEQITGARLITIANAGHMVALEKAREVAAHVQSWLGTQQFGEQRVESSR